MVLHWIIFALPFCFLLEHRVSGIQCTEITVTNTSQVLISHSNFGLIDYSSYYEACWILTTENEFQVVGLTTIDFKVEYSSTCNKDKLSIYNSNTDTSFSKHAYFCGDRSDIFTTLYSCGRHLYLSFSTDSAARETGFNFTLKQYDSSKYNPYLWQSTDTSNFPIGTANDGVQFPFWVFGTGAAIAVVFVVMCFFKRQWRRQLVERGNRNPPPVVNAVNLPPGYVNYIAPQSPMPPPTNTSSASVVQAPTLSPPSYSELFPVAQPSSDQRTIPSGSVPPT